MTFRHLQAEVAKKKEVLRVTTAKLGTLQVLLDTERQSYTSGPNLERELVQLRHAYTKLSEIAKDLNFDDVGLVHTHSSNDLILFTGFGRLCQVLLDHLGHV